jgi:hypothetical protein
VGDRRSQRLRTARGDVDAVESPVQGIAQTLGVGGAEPATGADGGGEQDHVGRLRDELLGRALQPLVVRQRHRADHRPVHDSRAVSLQQHGLLLPPTVGGDAHNGAEQRGRLHPAHGGRDP